jgi:hypothetical protein
MGSMKKSVAVAGVVFLVSLLLMCTPSKAVSIDLSEARLIYDDGAVRVFALTGPEGSAESYAQAEVGPGAGKAKVKVLTCHVTNPPLVFYDTFPWIAIGESMAHYVLYEVLNVSDEINIKFTITGPQWATPYKFKTDWMGPASPGKYYVEWIPGTLGDGSDFYTTPGYYKITVKGIPKTNTLSGTSTATSQFHVEVPAPPTAP